LLLQPKILLQQPNDLLSELNILLLQQNDFVSITKSFFPRLKYATPEEYIAVSERNAFAWSDKCREKKKRQK